MEHTRQGGSEETYTKCETYPTQTISSQTVAAAAAAVAAACARAQTTRTSDLRPHLVLTEAHHEHQVRLDCIEHTAGGNARRKRNQKKIKRQYLAGGW